MDKKTFYTAGLVTLSLLGAGAFLPTDLHASAERTAQEVQREIEALPNIRPNQAKLKALREELAMLERGAPAPVMSSPAPAPFLAPAPSPAVVQDTVESLTRQLNDTPSTRPYQAKRNDIIKRLTVLQGGAAPLPPPASVVSDGQPSPHPASVMSSPPPAPVVSGGQPSSHPAPGGPGMPPPVLAVDEYRALQQEYDALTDLGRAKPATSDELRALKTKIDGLTLEIADGGKVFGPGETRGKFNILKKEIVDALDHAAMIEGALGPAAPKLSKAQELQLKADLQADIRAIEAEINRPAKGMFGGLPGIAGFSNERLQIVYAQTLRALDNPTITQPDHAKLQGFFASLHTAMRERGLPTR